MKQKIALSMVTVSLGLLLAPMKSHARSLFSWPSEIQTQANFVAPGARVGFYDFSTESMVNLGPVVVFVNGDIEKTKAAFADLETSLSLDGFRPGFSELTATVRYKSKGFKKILTTGASEITATLSLRISSCAGDLPNFDLSTPVGQLQNFLHSLSFEPGDLTSCDFQLRHVAISELSKENLTTHARLLTHNGLNNLVTIDEMRAANIVVDLSDNQTMRFRSTLMRPGTTSHYETAAWAAVYKLSKASADPARIRTVEEAYLGLMANLEDYRDELTLSLVHPEAATRSVRLAAFLESQRDELRSNMQQIREGYAVLPPLSQAFVLRSVVLLIGQISQLDRAITGTPQLERVIRTNE